MVKAQTTESIHIFPSRVMDDFTEAMQISTKDRMAGNIAFHEESNTEEHPRPFHPMLLEQWI
jgi:hypothetical protein